MAQFRNYRFELAAFQEITPNVEGNFLRCFEGVAPFIVQPRDQNPVEIQKGIGFQFSQGFNSVRLKNGATPQVVELYAGDGQVLDNRLVTQGGITLTSNTVASLGGATVGLTAGLVAAANPVRSSLLLVNTSPSIIYIGVDATVTTSTGIPVGAGQSFDVTFRSDVYAIGDGAGLDVRFIEESNP